ncbi:hypothetical protein JW998_02045 [candidate division KSB1 bacterium]|nr:hypothetical protein [candidate division KSB1 bacterium]
MKRNLRMALTGIIILAASSITYLFLWGKLFPFSPLIVGFTKHELSNSVIYVQNGATWQSCEKLDALIPTVQAFHELEFVKKPRLFIFRDRTSYLRRTTSRARFYAYPNGRLIISPWALQEAQEGTISLEIYIKHELSHTLLYQHMDLLSAYVHYPRWLLEGIAVFSAEQMGTSWYPSQGETYALIQGGAFMPPASFGTKNEDQIQLDVPYRMTFIYSEFACLVEHLIRTRGKDQFLRYMKRLLRDVHHDAVFAEINGIDFNVVIQEFKVHVMQSTP